MISVSLCMIVKNEEDVLERCLKSVAGLVDEIIIVDTGSTDRTREIATHFTNQSLTFPGRITFPPPGTKPFPMRLWTTACGWMPTTYFWRRIRRLFST